MIEFAHIINPVIVPPTSDLFVAQPVTFETIRRAKEAVRGKIDVTLLSAQYAEDRSIVPPDFRPTPDLERSVLDVGRFREKRKLPLLRDVIDRLYQGSKAEYLIYSNVDIALQPHFYFAVQEFIAKGTAAFVINRRTIPGRFTSVAELPEMMAEQGVSHKGWDCFVFSRDIVPHFVLGNVCLGASRVGLALLANLVAFGRHFQEFGQELLTFHIGDERRWLNPVYRDYDEHNTRELMQILNILEAEVGPFSRNSIPGQFLLRKRTFGPVYEYWARHIYLPAGLSRALNRLAGRR